MDLYSCSGVCHSISLTVFSTTLRYYLGQGSSCLLVGCNWRSHLFVTSLPLLPCRQRVVHWPVSLLHTDFMASIVQPGAMLSQRSSIAGRNAGARTVAPRAGLTAPSRSRCRRNYAAVKRAQSAGSAGRRVAVPVYATSSLQALGTTLIQKAAKAAKPGIFVAGM